MYLKKKFLLLFWFLLPAFIFTAVSQDDFLLVAEQMPEFKGGADSLNKFLLESIKYPQMAKNISAKGKVHVNFIVDEQGKITEVKVLKGLPAGLNKEATRVVESMPPWIPGKQFGKAVKVQITMQVEFPLEKKVYKDDDKRIRCNDFPNFDQMANTVYIDNQYYVWLYNQGVDRLKKKKYEEAEEFFNQAIAIIGTADSNPYFNRGIAKLKQGNESGACGDFRRAQKLWFPDIEKTIKAICK